MGLQLAGADREDLELYSSSLRSVHAGDTVVVRYVNGVEKQYTVKGIFYCELIQTDVSMNQIIVILQIVALIVAAITIFIVTYVDLSNKRRQIGIERAIGITPSAIVLSYIFRAGVYALVGILAAALIFIYVVVPLEARHPFHFPFGDVFLPVNISYLIRSALILCGVAVVSAFVPSFNTT